MPRGPTLLFALIVSLCLAQIGWWIIFQIRATGQIERAAVLLEQGEPVAAAQALGAEHSRRRRIMFLSEGAALGLAVLGGVVFLYTRMLRERRMRAAQERFLAGATHELKTPLATLRLGLESLQAERLAPERRERYLQTMLGELGRLEADVANLLAAARVAEARPRLLLQPGRLDDDVRSAVAEAQPRFTAAGIELSATSLAALRAARDPQALQMILRNLLDNAVKFCGRGNRVTVSLRSDAGVAELRVADDGPGMTADEAARAFERFYRGPGKGHVGGSGIGLHLVEQLASAHGGTAEAESPGRDRGSTFTVRLPLHGDEP